jgi:hypothetical protein
VRDSRTEKWGPIAGIVFAVLFVAAFFVQGELPSGDDSAAEVASFYDDSGNRAQVIIATYMLFVASVFFLWFLGSLRRRLIKAEGEPGPLTPIAFGAGIVFIAMLMVGAACFASVAGDIAFGDEKVATVASGDAARVVPQLGYPVLLIGGMFAAIAMICATSVLTMRTGVLPRWIGWYGFVAAVLLLAAVVFLPMILFVLWVLFVSIAMLRGAEAPAAPSPTQ